MFELNLAHSDKFNVKPRNKNAGHTQDWEAQSVGNRIMLIFGCLTGNNSSNHTGEELSKFSFFLFMFCLGYKEDQRVTWTTGKITCCDN